MPTSAATYGERVREQVYRWLESNRWFGDFVVAGFVGLVTLGYDGPQYGRAMLLLLLIGCVPLLFRSTHTDLAVLLGFTYLIGNLAIFHAPTVPVVLAPLLVHAAAAGRSAPLRWFALGAGLLGALIGPLHWWSWRYEPEIFVLSVGFCVTTVVVAYVIGERKRSRADRSAAEIDRAAERATFLATQDEQRTQVTLAAERARIARELHDIVAHSLSVVIVQAQGARAAVDKKPELAGPVLDTIAETSRSALAEMRTLVGVLRGAENEPGTAEYAPAQGIADLPALTDSFRNSGLPVSVEISGSARLLPPGLDLTVYRLVQESLTNVLKHGGPQAKAEVAIRYWERDLQVEVVDDGRGIAAGEGIEGGGHGLVGMRERVAAMGGEVDSGPRVGGGFAVRARLPYPDERGRR